MASGTHGEGRRLAARLAGWTGLAALALALAVPALAAGKPKKHDSLIRQGYGNYGGAETSDGDQADPGASSGGLVPDPTAPGGYRYESGGADASGLPGQSPSVIPDATAPGGYRYLPGVMSDPYAAPGGYRINLLPGEAALFPQTDQPAAPAEEPETGLLPQFRWPGEEPEYRQDQEQQRQEQQRQELQRQERQRQERQRQPEAAPRDQRRRYPWEPYNDRRSLRHRDLRQQSQDQD